MKPVDEYIITLTTEEQNFLNRVGAIAARIIPGLDQGVSYKLPAYFYKGKPVISTIVRKTYISIYPFSGRVIDKLSHELSGLDISPGTIRFRLVNPLSDELIEKIIRTKCAEIDSES